MTLGRALLLRQAQQILRSSYAATALSSFFSASSGTPISPFLSSSYSLVCSVTVNLAPSIPPQRRFFSTRPATSSLNDPSPNWSNRPPKETILLDGCDFEHWLVVMEPPQDNPTRDEIIDSYIKTLAQVLGSEEEARKSIYSVSTRHYYAFGCIVSEELSYKIKPLPKVRWVLPDSYLDVKNKSYGGEPFIDGQAVPYDPKYHALWVENNRKAQERSRRNDRPRNSDRSRNFERRREAVQNREMPPPPNPEFQNRDVENRNMPPPIPSRDMPSVPNQGYQNRDPMNRGMPPMPNQGFQNRDPVNRDMPPMPNQGFQNRDPINRVMPPMPNQGFQYRDPINRDMPPMPNKGFQSRDPMKTEMPPVPSQGFQSWDPPSRDMPPMQNQGFQNRDPMSRDMPPMPNQGFQNRNFQNRAMPPMLNQGFQNRDFQNRDMPPMLNQGFQNRDFQNRDMPNQGFDFANSKTSPRDMPSTETESMGKGLSE